MSIAPSLSSQNPISSNNLSSSILIPPPLPPKTTSSPIPSLEIQ
jgi:hypothetical protein